MHRDLFLDKKTERGKSVEYVAKLKIITPKQATQEEIMPLAAG